MIGTRTNFGWGRVVGLTVLALAASVAPLPSFLEPYRPNFVALTVLWLCGRSPRPLGLGCASCAGVALGRARGAVPGRLSRALARAGCIAARGRPRRRGCAPAERAAVSLALLWLNEFLLLWIEGVAAHPVSD